MKQEFSTHWKASRQPRKQRKYRANAHIHIRRKLISSNLTKELRKKYGRRNFPIRKGDSVKIMVGEFRGKIGKIENIDMKKLRVSIGGIQRTKKDGTKIAVYFNPSNLQIRELNLDDKKRIKSIERKAGEKNNLSSLEKKTSLKKEETTREKKSEKSQGGKKQ